MRVRPLGVHAVLIDELPVKSVGALARYLRNASGTHFHDAVAAYDVLALYGVGPDWLPWFEERLSEFKESDCKPKRHLIPICYSMGQDLESTAELLGVSDREFIRIHSEQVYECFAIGFSPGFAYLGHLPSQIAFAPRLDEPRVRVPKGSLGIAEKQTAVYPAETPGGWRLIGRCPFELVNVEEDYFPLEVGDQIEFVPISSEEYMALEGRRL